MVAFISCPEHVLQLFHCCTWVKVLGWTYCEYFCCFIYCRNHAISVFFCWTAHTLAGWLREAFKYNTCICKIMIRQTLEKWMFPTVVRFLFWILSRPKCVGALLFNRLFIRSLFSAINKNSCLSVFCFVILTVQYYISKNMFLYYLLRLTDFHLYCY